MKITFKTEYKDEIEHLPHPIKKDMPDWYKNIPSFQSMNRDDRTVKVCMPFQDALISGYCIPLPFDLRIKKDWVGSRENDELHLTVHWGNHGGDLKIHKNMTIDGHNKRQYSGMPVPKGALNQVIKLNMPYRIETPPGYSCLFVHPMNRERKYFEIISGIIDTDNYGGLTNFPSFLMDWDDNQNGFDTMVVPGGTPIAHVFPFKRDNWQMEIKDDDWDQDKWFTKFFSKWANNYKIRSWKKKDYR